MKQVQKIDNTEDYMVYFLVLGPFILMLCHSSKIIVIVLPHH